jgi:hypothetical protein
VDWSDWNNWKVKMSTRPESQNNLKAGTIGKQEQSQWMEWSPHQYICGTLPVAPSIATVIIDFADSFYVSSTNALVQDGVSSTIVC